MKKTTKGIIFVIALLCNTAFLLLCGYGKIHHEETATYWDPILGVAAVLVLALGNVGVFVQLYFRSKYRRLKCRSFDLKFWRQCLFLVIYYVGSVVYLSAMTFDFMVSYLSLFAIALSPLWLLGGSRTLWREKDGGEAYYLDDLGKWYEVHAVTENDNVVELKCTAPGDRDRTITIEKKK
ncbi:MAG: hypothetical protein IJD26_00190 [Lachnospiraceae bacterium]|nr:hypothetical protein [Lachnospiraceae bacterium]